MHDNGTTVGGYLTKAEAAEYANCSPRTIERAIQDRRLRAVGGRGRRRIRPEWIDDWLDHSRTSEGYEQGYQQGHDQANEFIGRHPHGMPWSALPDDDETEPDDQFERGRVDGWTERMKEEGWPTSRRA